MDGFDPGRRIGLIVDEWGTWHPPTPGEEPRWLFQQNTIRDALVAALTLDTFNRHADKVVMGNIAQTINVLQAMVLTDGPRMITTPTYHVYEMYKEHQGATAVRMWCEAEDIECGDRSLFGLAGSASVKGEAAFVTLVNPHAREALDVTIELRGGSARVVEGRMLAADDIHAHNTFDEPEVVRPQTGEATVDGDTVRVTMPPASAVALRGEK